MTEVFINKAKTCAVSGHRVLYKDFSKENLKQSLAKIIQSGFDTFLVGMAIGFDTECFLALAELRESNPIKIIACIPCESQSYKYTAEQKELYDKLIQSADERVLISQNYSKYCMMKRNKYMVDNCSLLLAYLKHDFGGTANTVKYAKKQEVQTIIID